MEMVFHINNGLRCNKCGKEISYEEFIPKYMQAKTDKERIEIFKCDCGGNFEESVKLFKDDSKKVILRINGHDISSRDYLKLRKYILYQNLPDFFDDSLLPKQIRDNERKKSEILSKDSGEASIEKKICALSYTTGMKLEDIYEMSIRKFNIMFGIMNDYTEYLPMKIALSTGLISMKDGKGIEHWLYKKKKERDYGASSQAEMAIGKLSGA